MLTPVPTLSSGAEDDEHEDRAGDVEAEHQHGQALERVDAGLADDGGDGAERADRGGPHDHRRGPGRPAAGCGRRRAAPARRRAPMACSAKPTSRATSRVCSTSPEVSADSIESGMMPSRNSVVLPCAPAGLLRRRRRRVARSSCRPEPGWRMLPTTQADRQREGRHRDEVAEREPADLADLGRAGDRADAEHDRAEDDRLDHHLDQGHEAVPSGLSSTRERRRDEADDDAERRPRRSRRCRGSGCGPCGVRRPAGVSGRGAHRFLQSGRGGLPVPWPPSWARL